MLNIERAHAVHPTAAPYLEAPFSMLVDGRASEAADGRRMTVVAPATGGRLADVPLGGRADVARAVEAARRAAPLWRATPLRERIAALGQVVARLRTHAEELAVLDAVDGGNPLGTARFDIGLACAWLEYQAGVAPEICGRTLPADGSGWVMTRREPYGIVARIGAFNHPLLFSAGKLGAPLVTGNVVILKLPDQAPLASLRLGEYVRDLFPPGVLQILSGDGPETGDALVRHPAIKRIAVIGSIPTGQRILASAAAVGIKHVSLELGGKNPMIVFPDADLDAAVDSAATGTNMAMNQGQSCGSISRLFLHESIHDAFLARLVARLGDIRIGDPLEADTQMGPLVSLEHYRRVRAFIAEGVREGARLALGELPPETPPPGAGFFVKPAVFCDVDPSMKIAREEIFGPVLSVFRWSDRDATLALANALNYGLTASVWTRDLATACSCAEALDCGYVWVNGSARHFAGAPFSGHKDSGLDTEEGIEELYGYTQSKTVSFAF